MKKHISTIRIIAFLVVLILITARVNSVLKWKNSESTLKFYEYDNNVADVIFYGASRTLCAINPSLLWDKYGIAAIDLAEGGQNLGSTYYYMEESLRTQDPKVMLVDLSLIELVDDGHDGNMYLNTINLRYSPIYVKNAIYEWSHSSFSDNKNTLKWILAKFPIYHTRYREITHSDYKPISNEYPAFHNTFAARAYETPSGCSETGTHELAPEVYEYLDAMMELAKENGSELVFYVPPYCVYPEQMQGFNEAGRYVTSLGYDMINYNAIYDDVGFDYGTDMQNEDEVGVHVNVYGSEKITAHMGEYLNDHFDLPDRRNEAGYEIYQTISDNWQTMRTGMLIQDSTDMSERLALLDPTRFDFVISISEKNRDAWIDLIKKNNPSLLDYEVSDGLFTSAVADKDGIYHLGYNASVTAGDTASIYVGDSSRSNGEQEAEILIMQKNDYTILHCGYTLNEDGSANTIWW